VSQSPLVRNFCEPASAQLRPPIRSRRALLLADVSVDYLRVPSVADAFIARARLEDAARIAWPPAPTSHAAARRPRRQLFAIY
jgi:hypothetical protein